MQKDIDTDDWGHGMPIIAPIVWGIIVVIGHTLFYIEQLWCWIKDKLNRRKQ